MSATSTTPKSSENANGKSHPDNPPSLFNIVVRGMGFEPMQPYGNRFLKTVPVPNRLVVLFWATFS